MKRMFAVLLSAALLMGLLPACNPQGEAGPSQPVESGAASPEPAASAPAPVELSCMDLVVYVCSALDDSELDGGAGEVYGKPDGSDAEVLSAYIAGAYGLEEGEWQEGYILRETGASAFELAVLRFAGEEDARHGEDCLKDYLHSREGDFTGYAPEQAKLVADAAVCRQGEYVGLFICEDSGQAKAVFEEVIRTGEPPVPTPAAPEDVARLLDLFLENCALYGDDTSGLERVDGSNPDRLKSIVEEEYGLTDYDWTDAAIARGTDGNVFEVAILHIDGDLHAGMGAVTVLNGYLNAREATYAPSSAQAELLHNAIAAWNNGFIALLVCNEPRNIAISLGSSLGYEGRDSGYSTMLRYREEEEVPVSSAEPDPVHSDRVKFTPPGKDDMSLYDTSAIRAAWDSGDPSSLSAYDREVYDAAQAILGDVLTDGMTDLEKETAIFHWLVNNVDYDWRHQDIMTEAPRSSYEPHGGLVDRTAVCLGYATSFQLLMDLAGVECITVVGAAFHSEEDHGWNMVRLNGNWYCVDATWDANMREQIGPGEPEDWRYFNVTSDRMAQTNHQWDYDSIPEATAEDHGQG